MTKYKKNLKPIKYDISLIYQCPNCFCDHWVSLKAAKIKNYKVVCDCDTVFKVKQINDIKVIYTKKEQNQTQKNQNIIPVENPANIEEKPKIVIDPETLKQCSKILFGYGYTITECKSLIGEAFDELQINKSSELIKHIFSKLGVNNG